MGDAGEDQKGVEHVVLPGGNPSEAEVFGPRGLFGALRSMDLSSPFNAWAHERTTACEGYLHDEVPASVRISTSAATKLLFIRG